jgi:hypothetical protein
MRRPDRDLQEIWRPLCRRGGKLSAVEGQSRSRNVVIEFPDYDTALACYNCPEYQANIKVRQPHSIADLIIVEGYDGNRNLEPCCPAAPLGISSGSAPNLW